MGGGGYSPSGKGRDNKLFNVFILFPLLPDGVLKMMMLMLML